MRPNSRSSWGAPTNYFSTYVGMCNTPCFGDPHLYACLGVVCSFALLRFSVRNAELTDRIPMGRWADPHEISGQVAFLCMPGASYMTSQVICVDGGWSNNGWM